MVTSKNSLFVSIPVIVESNLTHASRAILLVVAPRLTVSWPISSNNISVPRPPVVGNLRKSSTPSNSIDFNEPVSIPSGGNAGSRLKPV